MKKFALILLFTFLLSACELVAPYSVTFTTPNGSEVLPFNDTLDLVVSQPAHAYISDIACEGADPIAMLPTVKSDDEISKVHNLFLGGLDGYAPGTECNVVVTIFDQSTTSTSYEAIKLIVAEEFERTVDGEVETSKNE